jgi:non-heme chloroperoxidase
MSEPPTVFHFDGAGVRLAGERWDGGGADAVVLLHGGGQTRHSWTRTCERLAHKGAVAIALDARGHGDSEWHPARDYSLDGFVEDLLGFLATLDARPVLVGASLGGITAMKAVGEHEGIARGLVLVDVVVRLETKGVNRIRDFMRARPEGFASLDAVADAIAAYNPERKRPRNLDGVRKNVRLGDDGRWHWHWDPAFMEIGDEPQRMAQRARLEAAASNVKIPTLVVHGGKSDIVSEAGLEDILERIPSARVVDVAAAGHMVAGDDNDVFGDALEAFIDELD